MATLSPAWAQTLELSSLLRKMAIQKEPCRDVFLRTLEFWVKQNKTKTQKYYKNVPRCRVWGCFGRSTATDSDLLHVVAEACFCQLQIVSVTV